MQPKTLLGCIELLLCEYSYLLCEPYLTIITRPTFVFLKGSSEVDRVKGANKASVNYRVPVKYCSDICSPYVSEVLRLPCEGILLVQTVVHSRAKGKLWAALRQLHGRLSFLGCLPDSANLILR